MTVDGHRYTAEFEAPNGEPVLEPYLDTQGIPTVGLGHTGPDVIMGETWTRDRCLHAYENDRRIAIAAAPHAFGASTFSALNEPRQAVAIDLCFNPGPSRLALFRKMLDAIHRSDWQTAHDELLDSRYARQVKRRAILNAQVLLTGEFPNEVA